MSNSAERSGRWPAYVVVAWSVLLLLAVFPVVASGLDLITDGLVGIPADHAGTFQEVAGTTWSQAQNFAPGATRYVTLVERGYALHELTFGLLFLVIVVIPLRRRERWAWWASWLFMISAIGYIATFGVQDPAIFWRAVAVALVAPTALLAFAPHLFGRHAAHPTVEP